ncbi:MAG: glycosyltransferase family 4 protein [Bernardetiaceae bacterium]
MKILLLTPSYPPDIGACAHRVQRLAESLSAAGHRVRVLTVLPSYPSGKFRAEDRWKIWERRQAGAVSLWRVRYWPSRSGRLGVRLWSTLTMSAAFLLAAVRLWSLRPDVVWVQVPPWPLPWVGILLARLWGARLILNLSDLHPRALLDMGKLRTGYLYKTLIWIEKKAYATADILTGQSEEILDYLRDQVPNVSSVLYRNGLVSSQLADPKQKKPQMPLRWVYAGTLGEAQNLLALIAGLDWTNIGQTLDIYGDGPQRRAIQAFIQTHQLAPWVRWHKPVSQFRLTKILSTYDAALVVQGQHILGTVPSKVYEAMGAGLPILLLGGGEAGRIVEESGCGWVCPPGDYASLVQFMRILAACSAEDYQRYSAAGVSFARVHLMHTQQFERFLAALDNYC